MFKRAVIVLMLLITPFAQARAVMICSMNTQPVERCSCPGNADHGERMRHDAPDAACCTVVIEAGSKAFAGVITDAPVVKRANPAPDVTAMPVVPVSMPSPAVVQRFLPAAERLDLPQYRLYLRTARLRL